MAIYENKFEIGDKVTIDNLGGQYLSWLYMSGVFGAKSYCQAKAVTNCVVLNYTLHPDHKRFVYLIEANNGEQYLYEENSLAHIQQDDKEMEPASTRTVTEYKQRSEWVKNTGEKPDLPDGTLVTIKWCDGDMFDDVVEDIIWKIGYYPTTNIVKWKLANDWNKVVDGKVPAIDPSTLIEVKNEKDYGGNKYKGKVDDFAWAIIKKWRYAKKA